MASKRYSSLTSDVKKMIRTSDPLFPSLMLWSIAEVPICVERNFIKGNNASKYIHGRSIRAYLMPREK